MQINFKGCLHVQLKRQQVAISHSELLQLVSNIIITHADWLNEERFEHASTFYFSFSLRPVRERERKRERKKERERERKREITHADSLTEEHLEHASTFCLHVHATLSPSDRSESERKRESLREREWERGREGGRERDVEYGCFFFFFKGMMGALAPFSYLLFNNSH